MKSISIVPLGNVDRALLDSVRTALSAEFDVACSIESKETDPQFAFRVERQQYHSTELLTALERKQEGVRRLGIIAHDLFIPILKYVFGEAQLGGSAAVASYFRLREEFYGLPADRALLTDRLIKEAVHEIGHTVGLTHCDDYNCAMAATHSVEWVDVKSRSLCANCRARAGIKRPVFGRW